MYIDGKQYKKLIEAKNNGDEKAKAILLAQYRGEDDTVANLLEEYFKPASEPEKEPEKPAPVTYDERLSKFLSDNGVKEGDENYESMVEEFKNEFPPEDETETEIEFSSDPVPGFEEESEEECGCDYAEGIEKLLADEIEAVKEYDKQILIVANSDLSDSLKKGIIATYNEIKAEELHHIEELKKIKGSIEKKEEKV